MVLFLVRAIQAPNTDCRHLIQLQPIIDPMKSSRERKSTLKFGLL